MVELHQLRLNVLDSQLCKNNDFDQYPGYRDTTLNFVAIRNVCDSKVQ